jgi:energy-converting hydrogenase Eha subunit H
MSKKQHGASSSAELLPVSRSTPKINLQNAAAIRRELAAVYRDARAGKIETQDATRFGYLLNLLGQAYEREVLENRLEALEAQQS